MSAQKRVYSLTKIFHYPDKLKSLAVREERILPPLHIRIKPTNVCNHRCHYCAYLSETQQLGQDMEIRDTIPREKMLEIVEDLEEMGVGAVTFSGGGEPFCYPYFLETVEKLVQSPIAFSTLTNGSRLTGKLAELFAFHGRWVRISIDGWDEQSYSHYRNVSGEEFRNVIRNMTEFKKLGGTCDLGASFIIDQTNAEHVYEFLQRLKETGIDSVKVSPCIIYNDGRKNNEYHRPIFHRVKEQTQRAKSELEDGDFEIFDAYHELEEKFDKDYHWCPYLQIMPVIGADLRVYSCHDKAYDLKGGQLGSIREQRFRDFWFSDKKTFFRLDPSRHCRHHCAVNMKNKLILDYLESDPQHLMFL